MLVTSPTVARLLLKSRKWAYRRARTGDFGMVYRRKGRALWVDLGEAERRLGIKFTPKQLVAVGLIRNPPETESDNAQAQ
jgi:hypothetical protein